MNPLRYRGYYYDNETGYYYLQSRYYDPELGRFISADDFAYVDTLSHSNLNAYAYCNNCPINNSDHSGTKSVNKETKNYIINRYKKYLKAKGYAYIYNNAESNNYHVAQDSNGIYSLTGEHRFNSGKKYYNSVYYFGYTNAWSNEYQEACRSYEMWGAFGEMLFELSGIPLIIVSILLLLTGGLIIVLRYVAVAEQVQTSYDRYQASKSKGYYEILESLSVTTFNKNKVTTTYII